MKKFLEFGTPERTTFSKKITPGEMPNGKFQKADHIKKKKVSERTMTSAQKVAQMQHYWDNLDHMASDERKKKSLEMRFKIRNIKLDPRNKRKILSFDEEVAAHAKVMAKKGDSAEKIKKMHPEITDDELESIMGKKEERDYKDEYKKFQSTKKAIKYRAELNRYNRKRGTYGNNDGKDASHKNGKIVGFEDESINRGRREKSRLKVSETFKSFEEYFYEAGDERMDKYVSNEIKKRKLARHVVNATDDYRMIKGKPDFKFPSPTGSMMLHVWLRPMPKPASKDTKAFNYQMEEK